MRRFHIVLAVTVSALAFWIYRQITRSTELPQKPRTVEQTIKSLAPRMEERLDAMFRAAQLPFPPVKIALLGFKEEERLDLYATDSGGKYRFVHSWPILAASGGSGLKLQEGDGQVPEGFYRIELLNPNSRFHLSLRINYPNAEDIARAEREGRATSNLGSDIMIHGGAASIGCIAIGDKAVEELFYLAARTGIDQITLLIAPRDFRGRPAEVSTTQTADLYERIAAAQAQFPAP